MRGARKFRAVCFGRPIGPWRACRQQARDDLVGARLADYDDRGRFFITVPGDLEIAGVSGTQPQSNRVSSHISAVCLIAAAAPVTSKSI